MLLYLEAQARGGVAAQQFSFSAEHLDAMLEAARTLKLRGLEDLCLRKMGEFESRVRTDPIPWAEVVARNTQGEALLVMDGMVLEDTTTGTFYTVGEVGRYRGWGYNMKPLGQPGDFISYPHAINDIMIS